MTAEHERLRLIGEGKQRRLTHREIAKILNISHGTVQNIERRALAKLRKLLADGWAS